MGPNITLTLFRHKEAGSVISWTAIAGSIAGIISPLVLALLPSYDTFFMIGGVIFVVALVFSILVTGKGINKSIQTADLKYIQEHGAEEKEAE